MAVLHIATFCAVLTRCVDSVCLYKLRGSLVFLEIFVDSVYQVPVRRNQFPPPAILRAGVVIATNEESLVRIYRGIVAVVLRVISDLRTK